MSIRRLLCRGWRTLLIAMPLVEAHSVALPEGSRLESQPASPAASCIVNSSPAVQTQIAPARSDTAAPTLQVNQTPIVSETPFHPLLTPAPAASPLGATANLIVNPSPQPSVSFAGLDDIAKAGTSTYVIPPDADGAVGLTKVVCGFNNNYRIQDKSSGATLQTISIDTFWNATGGSGFFDPRTIYDPYNDRWIVAAASNRGTTNSSICVGVSLTGDPAGAYYLFRQRADVAGTNWADFPCLGFNRKWVAINVDMFTTNASPSYVKSRMLVMDYAQLRSGVFSGVLIEGTGMCSFPASTYSATEDTLYVATHLSSGSGTYRLDTITGAVSSATYRIGATKSRGTNWVQAAGDILPQAAPLSGTSICGSPPCMVEPLDAQIRSAPVFRNGFIYYAQTVGLPASKMTRTAIIWTRLAVTNAAVIDGGFLDDPAANSTNGGKWHAFPHLAVNRFGDVMLGFSQFASTQYPSAGYAFRYQADPAGTLRTPVIYKAGEDYYHQTGVGRNRWGDYSKAQVDPANDQDLWVLNEYAKARVGTDDSNNQFNSSRWGTWWAKIAPIPPSPPVFTQVPQSAAAECGDNLTLSGAATGTGTISYTWYRNTTRVGTGPTLTFSPATIANSGSYVLVATDSNGLSATSSPPAVLTISDTRPPILALPSNITTNAPSMSGVVVTFQATAVDACAGNVPVTCVPASGSTFPPGTTLVQCSANDGNGNITNGSFSVTVNANGLGQSPPGDCANGPLLPPWGTALLAAALAWAGARYTKRQQAVL